MGRAEAELEVLELVRVDVDKVLLFREVVVVVVEEVFVLDVFVLDVFVLDTEEVEDWLTDEDVDTIVEIPLGVWVDEAKD